MTYAAGSSAPHTVTSLAIVFTIDACKAETCKVPAVSLNVWVTLPTGASVTAPESVIYEARAIAASTAAFRDQLWPASGMK